MEIIEQMLRCAARIDFAIFTSAQSSGTDDTVIRLTGSGTRPAKPPNVFMGDVRQ